jgi:hypothetical protein
MNLSHLEEESYEIVTFGRKKVMNLSHLEEESYELVTFGGRKLSYEIVKRLFGGFGPIFFCYVRLKSPYFLCGF